MINIEKMSIGAKFGLFILIGLLIVTFVNTSISYFSFERSIQKAENRELDAKKMLFQQSLEEQYKKAVMLSTTIAELPDIQKDFYFKDRDALTDKTLPVFEKLKEVYSIKQFQFHTPPATSFLRLHKVQKFGDDLSGFRKTVVKANKEKTTVSGLEVGVAGLGVRGISPVFYNEQHVGTLEFGLSFGQSFFEKYKALSHTEIAMFIHREGGYQLFASTFPKDFGVSKETIERIKDLKAPLHLEYNQDSYALLSIPIYDYSDKELGKAILAINIQDYVMQQKNTLMLNALSFLLSLVVVAFFIFLVNRQIGQPLHMITQRMIDLSEGDIESDIPCKDRHDEIGKMAQAFRVFQTNERERIHLEKEQQEKQRKELERSEQVTESVSSFRIQIEDIINSLNETSNLMKNDAELSNHAISDVLEQSSRAKAFSEEAFENVQTVASAATELTASIQEISHNVDDTANSVEQCTSESHLAAQSLETLQATIANVDHVIESINSVAEQTNLLALNATIEAARAGEAGKGFAVVAGEVKVLAKQTADMTEEISKMVSSIKESASGTITTVNGIVDQIQTVNSKTSSIAEAVEEQSKATSEIERNINQAASGTRDISEKIIEVRNGAETSANSSNVLKNSTGTLVQQAEKLNRSVSDFLKKVS